MLDLLTSLVEKSLVQYDEGEEEGRYRLLETIRQYGSSQLRQSGTQAAWQERHRDSYLAFAERARTHQQGPEQALWHERLAVEQENWRAALAWTIARKETDLALRFGAAIWRFRVVRGHWTEGRERFAELLALSEGHVSRPRYVMLLAAGELADWQCEYAEARSLYGLALDLARELEDPKGTASALMSLGGIDWYQGELARAREILEEALEIERGLDDPHGLASVLANLAGVLAEMNPPGELEEPRRLYEETLAIRRSLGDQREIAGALANLGMIAQLQENWAEARGLFEEAVGIYRQLGDPMDIASNLMSLGVIHCVAGEREAARALYEESRRMQEDLGDRRGLAATLSRLAILAVQEGEHETARQLHAEEIRLHREIGNPIGMIEALLDGALLAQPRGWARRATRLLGAADARAEALGCSMRPADTYETRVLLPGLREALGEEVYEATWAEGRAMTLDEALDHATEGGEDENPASQPGCGHATLRVISNTQHAFVHRVKGSGGHR